MSPIERAILIKATYGLAFAGWSDLNPMYRGFLVCLIKSERQQFIDYVRNETVLGQFFYELQDIELFLKMVNLLEQPCTNHKTAYTELSFSLLLSFNINLSVKYLSDKIRYARADSFDLTEVLEKAVIGGI